MPALLGVHDSLPLQHNGTGAGISATFRISMTSADLSETYLTWFRIVQGPRICNYFFYNVRRPRHMSRNTEFCDVN